MQVLLSDGQKISDDACQQRRICGLPVEIVALLEEDSWQTVLTEADENANEYKWVHSRVGPIRIKDRAAMSLKSAGFAVTDNQQRGKTWEKTDKGIIHRVQLQADGNWLHQSATMDARPMEKNMARGVGHKSLVRHMEMSKAFQFSAAA